MMARAGGDALMARFAGALRRTSQEAREAAVVYETWLDEKEMKQMNAVESNMTRRLIDGLGEAYREDQGRKWPANNAGRVHEPQSGPRTTGVLGYPVQTEPVDEDRAARGAREPAMSDRLRGLAREVAAMAKLSSNARQRNRLLARAAELQRMSTTQWQREMENDVSMIDDPSEAGNVLTQLANDMKDEAEANGAQQDDVPSFDDWSEKPGADDQITDDVADQRDDALDLGEDVPRGLPPRPGARVTDDQFGSRSDVADEPAGARKNKSDDDVLQRVRRGTAKFDAGQPRGSDRYGRRQTYSAFESARESTSGNLTEWLLAELDVAEKSSHSFF